MYSWYKTYQLTQLTSNCWHLQRNTYIAMYVCTCVLKLYREVLYNQLAIGYSRLSYVLQQICRYVHTSCSSQLHIIQLTASGALYLPPQSCTFFLCNCLIYNTIITTMMIMMMTNIPPTAPPITVPTLDELLLLVSDAVN